METKTLHSLVSAAHEYSEPRRRYDQLYRSRVIRDVVLGLGPWSLVVLKDKIAVLGPGLGLEPSVLGPVLGLAC